MPFKTFISIPLVVVCYCCSVFAAFDDVRCQPTCRKRLLVWPPVQLVAGQPFQMLARRLRFVL